MSFESINQETNVTEEEAGALYESLPEGMKTGFYGLVPRTEIFGRRDEAGAEALPHIIVTFEDGKRISLHLSLNSALSFEEQATKVKLASHEDRNIKDVQLMWQPDSEQHLV
jgi:hypothetical protein